MSSFKKHGTNGITISDAYFEGRITAWGFSSEARYWQESLLRALTDRVDFGETKAWTTVSMVSVVVIFKDLGELSKVCQYILDSDHLAKRCSNSCEFKSRMVLMCVVCRV